MKLSDNPNCILNRLTIAESLEKAGYKATEEDFKKYLKVEIKEKTVKAISKTTWSYGNDYSQLDSIDLRLSM